MSITSKNYISSKSCSFNWFVCLLSSLNNSFAYLNTDFRRVYFYLNLTTKSWSACFSCMFQCSMHSSVFWIKHILYTCSKMPFVRISDQKPKKLCLCVKVCTIKLFEMSVHIIFGWKLQRTQKCIQLYRVVYKL